MPRKHATSDEAAAVDPASPWAFQIRPLDTDTWEAFATLVERHLGVWGGCWCLNFHPEGKAPGPHRRDAKWQRVQQSRAHAALVFEGEACIGWCQFGSPEELPRIKHLQIYQQETSVPPPDWRITCFFTDKAHRGRGVSSAALAGALAAIARLGGGRVESAPEDVAGRKVSAAFLYNSRLAMFERQGFERVRPLGRHHWLVARQVLPA